MIELVKVVIRNGDQEFSLGDTLRVAFNIEPRKYPEDCDKPEVRKDAMRINLFVEAFESYGVWQGVISPGMTGVVHLLGYDASAIVSSRSCLAFRYDGGYMMIEEVVGEKENNERGV